MVVLQNTWRLLLLALQPVVEVVLMCGLGAWLAQPRVNIFPPIARDHLNKLVFTVFSPAFVFSSLGEVVDATKILEWWYLPFNVFLVSFFGFLMGNLVVWVCKPPPQFHRLTISCCIIGNVGNLTLVLVYGVCRDPSSPFGDENACLKDGIAKVSFSMWAGTLVMWTFIYNYLKPQTVPLVPENYLANGKQNEWQNGDYSESEPLATQVTGKEAGEVGDSAGHGLTSQENGQTGTNYSVALNCVDDPPVHSVNFSFSTDSQTGISVAEKNHVGNHDHIMPNPTLHVSFEAGKPSAEPGGIPEKVNADVIKSDGLLGGDDVQTNGSQNVDLRQDEPLMANGEAGKLEDIQFNEAREGNWLSSWIRSGEVRYKSPQWQVTGTEKPQGSEFWIVAQERFKKLKRFMSTNVRIRDIFTPPTTAVVVGLTVGVVPPLKNLFFREDAPLRMITQSIEILGMAMIPSMMLVLGGNLSRGPGQTDLGFRTILGITATRLIFLPLIGLASIPFVESLGITPPGDSMMKFINMLQFSCPTAINVGSVAQLHGVGEREASIVLFWGYILCAFPLVAFMIIFFALLV